MKNKEDKKQIGLDYSHPESEIFMTKLLTSAMRFMKKDELDQYWDWRPRH